MGRHMLDKRSLDQIIADWPAKSAGQSGEPEHPAVYHMLDVAAVAEVLLAPLPLAVPLKRAMTLLTALHDLGKIGEPFRVMLRDGKPQGVGAHWEVTEVLLTHHSGLLMGLGGTERQRRALYASSAGHHGRPPRAEGHSLTRMLDAVGAQARADSGTVIGAFMTLWKNASIDGADITALSWWLPGLIASADWIGSNTDWFTPCPAGPDIATYLERASILAKVAVREAGLETPGISGAPLFDFSPRPMQQACTDIPLPDGPTLAIIEDETGAGKTEAALILAHRMMQVGKGRGLYFALPTMATSDAMFSRARTTVADLFTGPPSLVLAHGRAALSDAFRSLRNTPGTNPDEPTCSDWLADNRRRTLLADVGIGTIDQALLGVLPTKHSCLRLFGLSSKILIVDEVHELGEPYLATELAHLLRAQAMNGGSAILLTATLPIDQRATLIAAFEAGAGRSALPCLDRAYPALTLAQGAARRDFPQTTGAKGPIAVARLPGFSEAVQLLTAKAQAGAACVWVRNAVDDAIAAVEALRANGVNADLLHARFALCDRKMHESIALGRFGKTGQGRAGRVLVATQVVESSLDLDFDVMVSDLAPMAALIQRAGRLWRHMDLRPASDRPMLAPTLHVVAPDPNRVETARWLHDVLDAGAWVYPQDVQWRTAETLFRIGEIVAPSGLRALIEAVHGPNAAPVPTALEQVELESEGRFFAAQNLGRQNVIKLDKGYRFGGAGFEDTDYPTRLGREQRVLVLARREADKLRFWHEAGSIVDSCQLSEVTASAARLSRLVLPEQDTREVAELIADLPDWKQKSIVVFPVAEDGIICAGLQYHVELGLLFVATEIA